MAIYSYTGGPATWDKITSFTPVFVGGGWSGSALYGRQAIAKAGVFKLMAAIVDTASTNVYDYTASTIIYTCSAADTPYTGTPASPLATYNYPAGNTLAVWKSGASRGAFAGYLGEIPAGLSCQVVCAYTATLSTTPIAFGFSGGEVIRAIFFGCVHGVPTTALTLYLQTSDANVVLRSRVLPPASSATYTVDQWGLVAVGGDYLITLGTGQDLVWKASGAVEGWLAGIVLYT